MPEPAGRGRAGLLAFRYRNYQLFWIGQLATNIGTWVQMVATGWLVLQLTNSPASLGINATIQAVPTIAFAFLGGVIGDRADRLRLMVVGQAVRTIPDIVLAVLVATGHVRVEYVYLYSFVAAVMGGLTTPGRQAFVLFSAIALNSTVWQGAAIVGPSFAGVALAVWGLPACFYINALSDVVN